MKVGIASLVAAYVLSQFYRAFLAVLSPVLKADLGLSAEQLASASGLWFLAFALAQFPIGSALDSIGPRRTTAVMLAVGGAGGAAVFATAEGAGSLYLAMILIGAGCAPVLMASYYIFARTYSAAVFGTLAGAVIGFGSLGNVAASVPLSAAVAAFGWRGSLWGMAALTLVVAAVIALLVRDPVKITSTSKGSILDLLRLPALWPVLAVMVVCYAPAAGLRGLWVGPYFADVHAADAAGLGRATLVMGLAMVAGNFAYGPAERWLGTRKWLIFGGNLMVALLLLALWAMSGAGAVTSLLLFAGIGFFGSSFGMVIAHGRAFYPPHLIGRGVTLLNFFGISAVGLGQVITGRLHAAFPAPPASAPYQAIFGFFALSVLLGLAVYAFSRDRTD